MLFTFFGINTILSLEKKTCNKTLDNVRHSLQATTILREKKAHLFIIIIQSTYEYHNDG